MQTVPVMGGDVLLVRMQQLPFQIPTCVSVVCNYCITVCLHARQMPNTLTVGALHLAYYTCAGSTQLKLLSLFCFNCVNQD